MTRAKAKSDERQPNKQVSKALARLLSAVDRAVAAAEEAKRARDALLLAAGEREATHV